MPRAYYNELEPYAAQWLRNLIAEGLIADGDVDERSIVDVRPDDLAGYTQCHFFGGVGGWSLALRLAGWPDDRPAWTGSCPCQPFSGAGKRAGFDDERHLWPAFHRLIAERRPPVVFGEQVASKDGLGWLDLVQADLEGSEYASGAVDMCAAGLGAPHIRQRLWWVAERLAYCHDPGLEIRRSGPDQLARPQGWEAAQRSAGLRGVDGRVADTDSSRLLPRLRDLPSAGHGHSTSAAGCDDRHRIARPTDGFWSDADWLSCRDGKWRPVEPGTFPLAHGVPGRVGRLRAFGNAIVPQVAAEFIRAYCDVRDLK